MNGIAVGRGTMHARQTPASKVIVTDASRSGARVFQNPGDISWTERYGTTPRDGNTFISPPRLNCPVLICGGITISPTRMGSQDIYIPKSPTGPVEVRNSQIFHTSINRNSAENGDPTPAFGKIIGRELSHESRSGI